MANSFFFDFACGRVDVWNWLCSQSALVLKCNEISYHLTMASALLENSRATQKESTWST